MYILSFLLKIYNTKSACYHKFRTSASFNKQSHSLEATFFLIRYASENASKELLQNKVTKRMEDAYMKILK